MSIVPEQAWKPTGDWSRLLPNKVVFVTGAGGGLGSAIAQMCAIHGARVVVADINKTAADETVNKILSEDPTKNECLFSIELDVVDETSIERAVKAVVEKWQTIDVLVNKCVESHAYPPAFSDRKVIFSHLISSAAIFTLGPVEAASAEAWTKILNVNVRGYALMAKAIVPILKKQRSGSIIQMASISSWIAQPEFVPYSTTKGAVLQMTRNLALDLGPFNIRCNAICPGTIQTQATETHASNLKMTMEEFAREEFKKQCIKRFGSPQEVANLTVFLASDLCHFATGASFMIDGGYTTI